jgi:hypothetical protein
MLGEASHGNVGVLSSYGPCRLHAEQNALVARNAELLLPMLPARYDAFIQLERTSALDPLHIPARIDGDVPETYPTGQ